MNRQFVHNANRTRVFKAIDRLESMTTKCIWYERKIRPSFFRCLLTRDPEERTELRNQRKEVISRERKLKGEMDALKLIKKQCMGATDDHYSKMRGILGFMITAESVADRKNKKLFVAQIASFGVGGFLLLASAKVAFLTGSSIVGGIAAGAGAALLAMSGVFIKLQSSYANAKKYVGEVIESLKTVPAIAEACKIARQ